MPVKPKCQFVVPYLLLFVKVVFHYQRRENGNGTNNMMVQQYGHTNYFFDNLQAEWMAPEVLRNEPSNEK